MKQGTDSSSTEKEIPDGAYVFRASFGQERLWFLDQLEPGSPLYSIPIALRLKGLLKHESLWRALNAIVDRHEGLRTTFATEQGKLVQVVAPERELPVPLVDLSHVPKSDRQSVAQRLVMEEAEQPFNLASGPLFRAMLLRLGDEEHLLLLTMHHIVSDAWSMVVFLEDLTTLYEAFSAGRPSPLPALPIQYADFAQWQLEVLEGELLREQIAYWRKQLAGVPAVLELPTDRPRPAVQTFRGAAKTVELPNELARQLRELSRREGVTLFMTLLAAFQTLLHRYSGQDDIVLGSPVVNRNRSELERLIGFFLNILVLRTNFSDNPTFRELLRRVREVALEAYAHQELPFEKLVEELQPQRSLSHNPLFQVMFVLKPPAQGELKLNDVSVEGITVDTRTSKLDLTLFVTEEPESLTCALEYNTDLFDGTTIDQMLRHYEQILKRVVANPEERIGQLSILSEAETSQLLIEWNAAATGYPSDKCFDQLFEEQVRRAPNALAVGFGDQKLTYSELNRRANQLAHFLKKRGVGPDKLVGICVERSFDMIVGLLGILKAGGAYLPLDPTYPRERLSYMLEEGDVSVLLTQESLRRSLPYEEAICLDVDWSAINEESEKTPKKTTTSDNLVYVIYTSGSTGKPKGVMITHRGLLNYLHYASRAYAIDRGGGALVHSPIGFDLTVTSVFAPLISGSHVSLLPEERGIEALAATLKNGPGYSVLKVTPSHLEGLSYLLVPEDAAQSTRVLIVGGEALYAESLHFWRGAAPAMRIINEYGPTETVVGCCVYEIKQNDSITGPVPIGRPIANTELYILDKYLHPVPIGVVGELHIGGAGVARGYLNRPELTAERFWPNPFSKGPGARFYKTGDRARYLRDGNIEFLGRADDQVKIKGYRVELGEIESALAEHPWLVDSVVVAREDTPGNRLLVGYVVPAAGAEVERREIVNFLSDKLPEYMVPAVFVVLQALPLTPNGKVDHRALPPPDRSHRETGYVAARTLVEATLTDIWARVLGLDRVGIHDNFFELGGDSILSIQIIASANKVGLRLTTKHIFQYQTIAELAQVAGTAEFIRAEQGLVTGPVPLTPVQRWFFEQDLPELHHFNQAMLLEVRRSLDARLLREAASHLLRHHDALRLRFVHEQVGWRQLNAEEDVGESFKYLDLSAIIDRSSQDTALTTAAGELQASLNISVGPLFRLAFFDMGPKGSRLMLVIHHLAVDGVSWRILLEDLQTAYEQLERGEVVKLSLKTTSFKQWAERLKEHAHSGVLAPEIDFWLEEVRREVIRLPVDYAGGENIEGSTDTVSMSLDAAETRALLQEVPAAYRTQINDGLLSALVESFAKWTGEPRLLVDLEGHGREEMIEGVDLSRTVGWFTSIFPVLLVGANGSRVEHLRSIKEQLRRVPNRGIGYGVLRYLSEDQQLGEQFFSYPQPELSFNYLGQFGQDHSEATMFVEAAENRGAPRSARQCRRYLLEVICFVKAGRLNVDWIYSRNIHRRATIEGLAQGFLLALRELVAGCQFVEDQVYSPSDFPDVQLSHRDLENILAEIGVADSKADSKDA
jgi:amino acid adenylation domain-containing protein/non-ribosomal peptide synthase protein (TIGR01720 family)